MLDAFLEHLFFLNRHRQAPLLKERESFLNQLQPRGTSRKAPRNLFAEYFAGFPADRGDPNHCRSRTNLD
jgi:hypothetical protein